MAFLIQTTAGSIFRLQPATSKLVVLAGQVPKGSRTKPPATARVVAGSRMVPVGMVLPSKSVCVPVCSVINS